jgi:2-C-methyl-D-erythritol 4-phosphate cytidylyltransferase/2-C-methyl-D-erythritol 2,4-cyclodiphosphate synthase
MVHSLRRPNAAAIIVAAGSGVRAGGPPKQFQAFGGKPLVRWSAERLVAAVERVVLVAAPGRRKEAEGATAGLPITYVDGGVTRTESVRAGLEALRAAAPARVLIHDAARPGVTDAIVERVLGALDEAAGAAPALPVADCLKAVSEGDWVIGETDRTPLRRVQTPQGFRYGDILSAYAAFDPEAAAQDDLAVAQAAGLRIRLVEGDSRLDKITFADDFRRMEWVLGLSADLRTGSGFDVHAFGPGDHIWLCGLKIPHSHGLIGHSDADCAWHALTDAILGALAEGDIGDHFPPSDERWRGAPSETFLRFAAERVAARGGRITHVDMTIVCEAPKVKPHREAMRIATADVLGLPLSGVSVKATTTEGLGFLGRREGLAAQALATIALAG